MGQCVRECVPGVLCSRCVTLLVLEAHDLTLGILFCVVGDLRDHRLNIVCHIELYWDFANGVSE